MISLLIKNVQVGLAPVASKRLYTEDDKKFIRDNYYTMTSQDIADVIGCSRTYVLKVWGESGLKGKANRTYYLNEDYFKIITHESAYWIGFIAADGCIYERKKSNKQLMLSITLSSEDAYILDNLLYDLDSNYKVRYNRDNKGREYAGIQINSDKLCNDLRKLGITTRKTYHLNIEQMCQAIGVEFFNSFMLGFFDGDGSISLPQNGISGVRVSISGYKDHLNEISKFLYVNYDINPIYIEDKRKGKYVSNQSFGELSFANTTEKYLFTKMIYSSPVKCMTRKKYRAEELWDRVENNVTNRSENKRAVANYNNRMW